MTYRLRILPMLAVAAAAALGAPASADETQGWDVEIAGNTCNMYSTFEDNVSVGLMLTGPKPLVSFMVVGDRLGKLAGKPGARASLEIRFDGTVPHPEWTDNTARVISLGDNGIAVVADWGEDLSRELTETVASSGRATISVNGKAMGSYDLAGSRAATEALTRCGAQIAAN